MVRSRHGGGSPPRPPALTFWGTALKDGKLLETASCLPLSSVPTAAHSSAWWHVVSEWLCHGVAAAGVTPRFLW